jgi:hypothetical protein
LIREKPTDQFACGTFDYNDLNTYLLLVVGLMQPEGGDSSSLQELAENARNGNRIPIRDIKDIGRKEPFITLPDTADLTKAVEVFGSGVHRIIVTQEDTDLVKGILSQLRLVQFLWENGRSFPVIDQLYPRQIRELEIGSLQVFAIK